jgi:hypothetical protein
MWRGHSGPIRRPTVPTDRLEPRVATDPDRQVIRLGRVAIVRGVVMPAWPATAQAARRRRRRYLQVL